MNRDLTAAVAAMLSCILSSALGCTDGGHVASDASPNGNASLGADNVDDGPGVGVRRVALTGDFPSGTAMARGWNLETGRIVHDPADADFRVSVTRVIMLFPSRPQVGFCRQLPGDGTRTFKRVEDIPSEFNDCFAWSGADLGGNSEPFDFAGQGFIVRDRNAVPVAKVMAVSGSAVHPGVQVTFDILKL